MTWVDAPDGTECAPWSTIMRTSLLVTAALVTAPTTAFALDQSAHEAISIETCTAYGLPADFCDRVGTEAYNVDDYEWGHPEAHAQIGTGSIGSACSAANAALERERSLGSDLRYSLISLSGRRSSDLAIHIATQLGRALHTIQDDCAHHGMPNDQHAWASLTDACTGSKTSPDVAPEALTCARTETATVMAAFVDEMQAVGVANSALDGISEGWSHWPSRADVCQFLRGANDWNGVDQRWENAVVAPWLGDQLVHAITTDDSSLGDACAVGDLRIYVPNRTIDVSTKPSWCFKVKAFCALTGKDDAPEAPPPWEDDSEPPPDSGGCNTSAGDPDGALTLAVVCVLGLTFRRRSRRACSG